ncbi:MAG: 30S ribosomal protein S12 methylthiotransferase RimO [Candidatus Aminicenantes bacterium]|nr:30S ribosomal protein S12 methylthiotransferase RimO [Candidatus Aminicenantes bacterium]
MEDNKTTVSFVSLGCFKNLVDTEVVGGLLEKKNIEIVSPYEQADWLLINTCGFIRDAKEESIDEILKALEQKEKGEIKHVAVFGCLTQRYSKDLQEEFKDVDILWGVNDLEELAEIIAQNKKEKYRDKELFLYDENYKRIITTTPNVTFIKISEGCNMKCSFCAIPQIRGSYRSRAIDSIAAEAAKYKDMGFREINLISQNSTYFGKDRGGKSELPQLLAEIGKLGIPWVRVLYLMPEEVTDEIIAAFSAPSIIPYFDLPFQHVAADVLKKMNRGGSVEKNLASINKIRKTHKDAVIRSSFIVGFPGETEADFDELAEFAKQSAIERIGVFDFSEEEGTEAFEYKDRITQAQIEERRELLMDISDRNIGLYNKKILGSEQEFIPLGPWEGGCTIGRIKSQAPDSDGLTRVKVPFDENYGLYKIKISGSQDELLDGEKI